MSIIVKDKIMMVLTILGIAGILSAVGVVVAIWMKDDEFRNECVAGLVVCVVSAVIYAGKQGL